MNEIQPAQKVNCRCFQQTEEGAPDCKARRPFCMREIAEPEKCPFRMPVDFPVITADIPYLGN